MDRDSCKGSLQGYPKGFLANETFSRKHVSHLRPQMLNGKHIWAVWGPLILIKHADPVGSQPGPGAGCTVH